MTNLESVIIDFDGKRDSIFLNYIKENDLLTIEEKELTNHIWKEAISQEFWNFKDLNIGKKKAFQFLKENYFLCDAANKIIATAISYEWL